MTINLNSPFSENDVATLIASVDDSKHRQIVVSKSGIADIIIPNGYDENLRLFFETFAAGGGYTGANAAKDNVFIKRVFDALNSNWPKLQGDAYIDVY